MGKKVKREHYVPRTYLHYFAIENKFFVFDKAKTEIRSGSIEDYACERYFYDVDFDSIRHDQKKENQLFEFPESIKESIKAMDQQHIEHFYGNTVETTLFNPIKKIINQFVMCNPKCINHILNEKEMDDLSLYVAIQLLRTKEFREAMSEMYTKLPLHIMKKMTKSDEEKRYLDTIELKFKDENYKKLYHAAYLVNSDIAADIALTIRNKIWIVGYCRGGKKLFTSDNPVVKNAHAEHAGLSSKGIEVVFPLTDQLILIMRDKQFFRKDRKFNNRFFEIDDSYVDYVNSLQVIHSYRYVFSRNNDFSLADEMIKNDPNLKIINGDRFLFG